MVHVVEMKIEEASDSDPRRPLLADTDTVVWYIYYLTRRIVFVSVAAHSKRKPRFTERQWAS
jgi:hypothetical protein